MVVPVTMTNDIIRKYVDHNLTSEDIAAKLAAGRTVSSNSNFQDTLTKYAVPPLWLLLKEAGRLVDLAYSRNILTRSSNPRANLALLTINKLNINKMWTPSGVKYLKVLRDVWLKGVINEEQDLDAFESGGDSDISQSELVSEKWVLTLKKLLYMKFPNRNFVVPKTPRLQGVNRYHNLKAFAHIAALNPSPQLIHMYKVLLGPKYDIDQDHSIENLVQMLYRTNLRAVGPKDPVLMIVPYRSNAKLLQLKVGCSDFQYLNEPRLTPWSYQKEVSKTRRIEIARLAGATSAKSSTIYRQDAESKRKLSTLRVALCRANAKLRAAPTDAALVSKIESIQLQLNKLKIK